MTTLKRFDFDPEPDDIDINPRMIDADDGSYVLYDDVADLVNIVEALDKWWREGEAAISPSAELFDDNDDTIVCRVRRAIQKIGESR